MFNQLMKAIPAANRICLAGRRAVSGWCRELACTERQLRAARVTAVQEANNLVQFTIDLQWPEVGSYDKIGSDLVAANPRHLLSCFVADGEVIVSNMPPPALLTGVKGAAA